MELDWSQVELARRSGYSERVIRKAEAGGKLRAETILDLADTMSGNGRVISFAELTVDLESIARRFVESYDSLGCGMLTACFDIFADDFAFNYPADPNQFSFAGVWIGLTGFQDFLNQFFSTFTRKAGSLKPIYMVCEDHVVARFEDQVYYQSHEMPAYWVNLHFQFGDGKVIRIDDEFDSYNASQSLTQLQNRESLDG